MNVTVGIMAYNEEKNIGRLLDAITNQKTKVARIKKIIVVSDGSTDNTNDIVKEKARKNKKIKLIVQKRRKGKSATINNFLRNVSQKSDVIILESADTLPKEKNTYEELCKPLLNQNAGLVAAHTIPANPRSGFMGFVTRLNWKIHHELLLIKPKGCELIAFRNGVKKIPKTTVDEDYIAALIEKKGLETKYLPNVIFYNKGPETIAEFLSQARRNYSGHLELKSMTGYKVSTIYHLWILKALFKNIKLNSKKLLWILGAVLLETYARMLGAYDYYIKKDKQHMWKIAKTTKELR